MLLWRIQKNWTQQKQPAKIVFKADRDQNKASLWKEYRNGTRRCLKSIPLRHIYGVRFIYPSLSSSHCEYHVELTTADNIHMSS